MARKKAYIPAEIPPAKSRSPIPQFNYRPRHERQREVARLWPDPGAKVIVLTGKPGTGKTHAVIGHSLEDLLSGRIQKIMLGRPAVELQESHGFLPGGLDLAGKLGPWLAAFADVVGPQWQGLLRVLGDRIEPVAVGFIRGRTVRDAVLLIDEAQNLTAEQLKCLATRVGENGKVVLSGDESQSDLAGPCRLVEFCQRMVAIDGFRTVAFRAEDQQRCSFVTATCAALEGFGREESESHTTPHSVRGPFPSVPPRRRADARVPGAFGLARP